MIFMPVLVCDRFFSLFLGIFRETHLGSLARLILSTIHPRLVYVCEVVIILPQIYIWQHSFLTVLFFINGSLMSDLRSCWSRLRESGGLR